MQTRLLHAVVAGTIVAIVLGFSLIPATWQMIGQEPTFEPVTNDLTIVGIIASVAIMAITLLSFNLVRRIEE